MCRADSFFLDMPVPYRNNKINVINTGLMPLIRKPGGSFCGAIEGSASYQSNFTARHLAAARNGTTSYQVLMLSPIELAQHARKPCVLSEY